MLDRLKIRTKLVLLAGVPVLALSTLIGVMRLTTEIQEVRHAQNIAALVVSLGEVAHELQKERDMSAGFLSSQGTKFADRLPGQRAASDNEIQGLNAALATVDLTRTAPEYSRLLQAALTGLDQVVALRAHRSIRCRPTRVVPDLQ